MLFTYKNCGCCKKEMTDLKDLLNNIFPAGICDEICDYNLHCTKCKRAGSHGGRGCESPDFVILVIKIIIISVITLIIILIIIIFII